MAKRGGSPGRKISRRIRRLANRWSLIDRLWRVIVWFFQLNDSPQSVSRGVGLGLFVAFTPTVGIQMPIVLLVNTLCRANRLVGVALVWLTNPITVIPVYWWSYLVGCAVLRRETIGFRDFSALFVTESPNVLSGFSEFVGNVARLGLDILGPLTLGGCLTGTILGVIGYVVTLWLLNKEREARDRLLKLRSHRSTTNGNTHGGKRVVPANSHAAQTASS